MFKKLFLIPWKLLVILFPVFCLQLKLLWLEGQLNRGKKIDEFHPWFSIDVRASMRLPYEKFSIYLEQLTRLRRRAHEQDAGMDVRNFLRGEEGWLTFTKSCVNHYQPISHH